LIKVRLKKFIKQFGRKSNKYSFLCVAMSVLPVGIQNITFYYLLTFSVMNIYIGNLNYRVKESDLQRVMEEYAPVTSIKLIKDRETGKSKGFGFVEIENEAAARQAISELNGSQYEGRTMVVKEALPR
jgi:hypothetical protein